MMENVNSCTDCGLVFDSSKSLDVHLSYHKETLMSKWGSSASGSEDNNNVKKARPAPADSSDFLFDFQEPGAFQRIPRTQYRYHPYGYDRQVSSSQVACDKCGMNMDASMLADHVVQMHPIWEEPQAEILDLDSHKVHVYQPPDEVPPSPHQPHWKYFKEENGNSPSPNDLGAVSSSEVYLEPQAPLSLPKASWKSNEARRPKTYNCISCNKWFTSSGHLKRHYNTTLHKNAVKQSGGVDPATMPVSSHHHPPAEEYHQPPSQPPPPPSQPPLPLPPPMPPMPQHHPAQQDYYHYGYHPNGNPPHGANLPSFSSLTGVNYEPVGGVYQEKEVTSDRMVTQDRMTERMVTVTSVTDRMVTPDRITERMVTVAPVADRMVTPDRMTERMISDRMVTDRIDQITSVQMVTSTDDAPKTLIHKCVDCDKTFNKACYLTQHNKSFHAGDKPFKCSRCGKRFTQEYLHLEHLQKHAGEKPYKCEICPKQFNHKTDLRRHMCLHSGDKPYACAFCGKGFIRKDHMLKHAETHKKKQVYKNEFRL